MSSTKVLLPNGTEYEQPIGLFINNEYIEGTGDSFDVIDPSIDRSILSLKGASTADVDTAVSAARKAFDEGPWSEINPKERSKQLFKLAAIIDQNRSLIAAIDAYDLGKPYEAALAGDLDESVNVFEYYAGWADKIDGKSIETSAEKLFVPDFCLNRPLWLT